MENARNGGGEPLCDKSLAPPDGPLGLLPMIQSMGRHEARSFGPDNVFYPIERKP